MQNDDAVRELWIEILLDDRTPGWAKAASTANVQWLYPEKPEGELLPLARLAGPAAWAYRDELASKPSNELRTLALSVAERQRNERAAAEYKARQEAEKALFVRWARKPYWSPKEAVTLLLGCDPNGDGWPARDDDKADDLTDLLERAIKAGQLKRDMSPAALLAWLRGVKVDVPAGLAPAVAELQPAKEAPKPAPAEQPAQKAKPASQADIVAALIVECEARATVAGEPFDRRNMPGQKKHFLDLIQRMEPSFKSMKLDSLHRYLSGQCKWSGAAKSNPDATPLYQKLFPEAWGNPGAASENRKKA